MSSFCDHNSMSFSENILTSFIYTEGERDVWRQHLGFIIAGGNYWHLVGRSQRCCWHCAIRRTELTNPHPHHLTPMLHREVSLSLICLKVYVDQQWASGPGTVDFTHGDLPMQSPRLLQFLTLPHSNSETSSDTQALGAILWRVITWDKSKFFQTWTEGGYLQQR